ncbi:FMN-binding negative transcriptional regulator [Streptomyces sp. NPDC058861]|uniref:FMN-binding negative transcriptional regulator n=1 Tax=Streptomyces sp. NPDC058861 TaxID=3346653 RepID=UPI00369989E8
MFVPSFYREPDSSWMVDVIRDNPLALAVSNGGPGEGPFATHLPVIFDPGAPGGPARGPGAAAGTPGPGTRGHPRTPSAGGRGAAPGGGARRWRAPWRASPVEVS